MRESAVGLQDGVDARSWARLLRRAHELTIRRGRAPEIVRSVIAESWQRCVDDGVDPDLGGAPLVLERPETRDRWQEHPLARMTDILAQILGPLLFDARHIVVVSDAEGCILWTDGHPEVLRAAERICFSPGFAWGEAAAGTNAVGTALAADRPLQVFSAEHFRSEVHGWQCSGAPVHDPDTGETLGAIDVTGSYETAHPHTLALVGLAAQLVEQQLRAEMFERDAGILRLFAEHTARHGGPAAALSQTGRVLGSTPAGWAGDRFDFLALDKRSSVDALGDGILVRPAGGGRRIGSRNRSRPAEGRLSLLARRRTEIRTAFGTRRLSARHGEICALLVLHPDGLDSHELAALLFGEPGHETAIRAELHRLRTILGPHLAARPYRLVGIGSDLGDALAAGVSLAELLPGSEVAAIVAARSAGAADA